MNYLSEEVKLLATLAKEAEIGDPFDWADVAIDEDTAYNVMAAHVLEMDQDPVILGATITKLLVENMILNARLLKRVNDNGK